MAKLSAATVFSLLIREPIPFVLVDRQGGYDTWDPGEGQWQPEAAKGEAITIKQAKPTTRLQNPAI